MQYSDQEVCNSFDRCEYNTQKNKCNSFIYHLKKGNPLVLYNTGLYTSYDEEMEIIKKWGKMKCILK